MGEDIAGAGEGSGTMQCGAKRVDPGSDHLGSNPGPALHSSRPWFPCL